MTATAHHRTVVIAEDAAGVPVRVTTTTKDTFALGGLPAGTYRLLAEDTRAGRYTERRITVAAGATVTLVQPLQPTTREPVLTGRLADEGTVLLRSAVDLRVFRRQVTTDHLGRFELRLFPGRFTPVTSVQGRTQAAGCAITIRTSENLRLPSGSRGAAMKGRGRMNGGIVLIRRHSRDRASSTRSSAKAGPFQPSTALMRWGIPPPARTCLPASTESATSTAPFPSTTGHGMTECSTSPSA